MAQTAILTPVKDVDGDKSEIRLRHSQLPAINSSTIQFSR